MLNNLFAYLNRFWVVREKEEGAKDVYEIKKVSWGGFCARCRQVEARGPRPSQRLKRAVREQTPSSGVASGALPGTRLSSPARRVDATCCALAGESAHL